MQERIQTVHKNIMKRVYYLYTLSLCTHPVTLHLFALGILGFVLARLVHVKIIYEYIAGVQVGQLGGALANLIVHADVPTLCVIGVLLFTLLSLRIQLYYMHAPQRQLHV